jgi:hypothetical protein
LGQAGDKETIGIIGGWSKREQDFPQSYPGPPPDLGKQELGAKGAAHARGLNLVDLLPRKPSAIQYQPLGRGKAGHLPSDPECRLMELEPTGSAFPDPYPQAGLLGKRAPCPDVHHQTTSLLHANPNILTHTLLREVERTSY